MPDWPIPDIGSPVPRAALQLKSDVFEDRIDYWEFFRHSDELTGGYASSVETYTQAQSPDTVEESYLVPHEKEDNEDFARRVALANPPRYVQEGIASITGVLTHQPPNRSEYPDKLQDWMASVTVDDASWQQFISTEVVPLVERYGLAYTLSRRPTVEGQTLGEQQRNREAEGLPEVMVHIISPEAVEWWVEDEKGEYEIVRYVESVEVLTFEPGTTYATDKEMIDRHWYLTREGWWYIDDLGDGTDLSVTASGFWNTDQSEMESFPLVKWALKDERGPTETAAFAQLAYYRVESELKLVEEHSAFPMVMVPVEAADTNPAEMVKGANIVGAFPSEATNKPFYLESTGNALTHYVQHRLPELEEQALSPYGRQREVGGNDSGVALAHIQETAKNVWRQQAKAFSQAEFSALQPISELLGVELGPEDKVGWPTQFGTLADSKQMENIQVFLDMTPGEGFEKLAILAAADVVLPNMTETEKQEAVDEWEKAKEEEKAFESERDDIEIDGMRLDNEAKVQMPFAGNPANAAGPAKER